MAVTAKDRPIVVGVGTVGFHSLRWRDCARDCWWQVVLRYWSSRLSSRYTTPALMAWAALFVILVPRVIRFVEPHRWKLWIPLLGLIFAMLPLQLKALQPQTAVLFEREVAALALEMRIKDQAQIATGFSICRLGVISLGNTVREKSCQFLASRCLRMCVSRSGDRLPDTDCVWSYLPRQRRWY